METELPVLVVEIREGSRQGKSRASGGVDEVNDMHGHGGLVTVQPPRFKPFPVAKAELASDHALLPALQARRRLSGSGQR